jgi:phosphoribosylformylglycinamidine synthase
VRIRTARRSTELQPVTHSMTDILVLAGPPALSRFRLAKTRARLRQHAPALDDCYAEFVHFVNLSGPLAPAERTLLDALLHYGPRRDLPSRAGELFCTVAPRAGTISPWSSKATDILRSCGLSHVQRVERGVRWFLSGPVPTGLHTALAAELHDRMTQRVVNGAETPPLFIAAEPAPHATIAVLTGGHGALRAADSRLGLALSPDEVDYLVAAYRELGRDPTDVELMMFAQANSEHCRHKIFNARWHVGGQRAPLSLFEMIRNTHARINGAGILSAYADNAAVIEGYAGSRLTADADSHRYALDAAPVHILMKVETHNHPTAIAPAPGAATGSGGEIRDEGAVGRGSKPKAGLTGFTTSHLEIPGYAQPWELNIGRPARIASALDIMLEGPIGAAAFNNEFGRPALCGYFRTFEQRAPVANDAMMARGYHKPVMIAGGIGNVRAEHVNALPFAERTHLIVLGGPAMLIGLGGGAASSMTSGQSSSDLDFASVQRDNPEMQRRCQEVIDACCALGEANPIRLIHDVGAGGLSNALPELVKDAGHGGSFELRAIPNADPGMSPLEIWCNEAQERYVLAVADSDLARFEAICVRERCPYAVVGDATADERLVVHDAHFQDRPVDLSLAVLFGKPPKMERAFDPIRWPATALELPVLDVAAALKSVLRFPAVASKQFLITIGDRSITGLVARDQMVGPWQVPVADAAVTLQGFDGHRGEAMAMGERPPLALIDPAASARMAIGEALTNLASIAVDDLGRVVLSANWMAAAGHGAEDQALFEAVHAVGMELCPALGIAIPVGKDSLSMRTEWFDEATSANRVVMAPVTLIASAFAPVPDVRLGSTPWLRLDRGPTRLLHVDLGGGRNRLGGSVLAQCYQQLGDRAPDVDDPAHLAGFFRAMLDLHRGRAVLAYHDRSDGGLVVTLLEMAFAGRCGLDIALGELIATGSDPLPAGSDPLSVLFAEELGAVLQVSVDGVAAVRACLARHGLEAHVHDIGTVTAGDRIRVRAGDRLLLDASRAELQRTWTETSYRMQRLRDNPDVADQEFDAIAQPDPGLSATLTFDPDEDVVAPFVATRRPRAAILREQGVNGQLEMAAAFLQAGFEPFDVHMSDLLSGTVDLGEFQALAACGGFSFGDVLGAGGGWAKSALFHPRTREAFADFFARDTLALGICNGCQMFAQLKSVIPAADHWPRFVRNTSEQFEARTSLVRINDVPSAWLDGMRGSVLPIAVAHGEGRAEFETDADRAGLHDTQIAVQFVDHDGVATMRYPHNPNGSPDGIAGLTAADGRVLIMMPHPERVTRAVNYSWRPDTWTKDGPWLRLFRNARVAFK